jgi:peptide methionine sulfoxide reductase msrA/msrB
MNKNLILAIGLVAVAVIGIIVYGNMKVIDPMTEEASMTTEMTTEMMSDDAAMTTEMMPELSGMKNEGDAAPAFDLMDVSGNAVSLESLKGERVYIKFWASWCSICLAGMDELNELSANTEGFKVITVVSPDFNGEQSSDDFIEWYSGLDYENIVVLLDPDGDSAKEYGVRGYPTSVYIGSDGVLIKQLPGHVENAKVIESFKSIY